LQVLVIPDLQFFYPRIIFQFLSFQSKAGLGRAPGDYVGE